MNLAKLSADMQARTGCSAAEANILVTLAVAAAFNKAGRTDLAARWLVARGRA